MSFVHLPLPTVRLALAVLLLTFGLAAFVGVAPAMDGQAAPAATSAPTSPCPPLTSAVAASAQAASVQRGSPALSFVRTELFFGANRPNLPPVSDADFQVFLDQVITPCFPDGLTLLTGDGQFRNGAGVIVRERSFLLILLYPTETRRTSSARIEYIREAYKAAFQQESVLRVDDRQPVSVAFEPLPTWALVIAAPLLPYLTKGN